MGADFLENLGKTITKTAEKVGKKAEEVVGVQKLRAQLAGTEREIDKNCQDLGEIVYRHFIDGEVMSEEIAIVCDEITRLRGQAADLREQIAQQRGESICPSCGAHGPKEAAFCMRCGAPLPAEEEAEEAEVTPVEEQEGTEEESSAGAGKCSRGRRKMIFVGILVLVVAAEWKIKNRMERSMKEGVVAGSSGRPDPALQMS